MARRKNFHSFQYNEYIYQVTGIHIVYLLGLNNFSVRNQFLFIEVNCYVQVLSLFYSVIH